MTPPVDVAELGLPLPELLSLVGSRFGDLGPLRSATGEPNGFATKASSLFVTLTFPDSKLELFIKKATAASSRRPDPPDLEVRLYAALQGDESFAAPTFVGPIEGDEPYLVLLRVPGWDLRYRDLELWHGATAALGRMHATYAGRVRDPEYLPFLPRQDRDRNLAEAEVAFDVVRRHHPHVVDVLVDVKRGYEDIAGELAREPWTLVHGDLAPKNVLIDATRDPANALFVDWEWAAVGPGLTDLADLINGLDPPTGESLFRAYVAEARGSALPASEGDIERSMQLALLHRTIFRLARSVDWEVEPERVRQWAREAAAHHAEL
jgi:Ser/Thr protein kinase RdoA (MazF antagonist)